MLFSVKLLSVFYSFIFLSYIFCFFFPWQDRLSRVECQNIECCFFSVKILTVFYFSGIICHLSFIFFYEKIDFLLIFSIKLSSGVYISVKYRLMHDLFPPNYGLLLFFLSKYWRSFIFLSKVDIFYLLFLWKDRLSLIFFCQNIECLFFCQISNVFGFTS